MTPNTASGAASAPSPSKLRDPSDEKLLELAFEDQENARGRFLRDFKLLLLAILGFQFLILTRFVRLSDEAKANGDRINALAAQQNSVRELHTVLDQIQSALAAGQRTLSHDLLDLPEELHADMGRLDRELKELRKTKAPTESEEADSVAQRSTQTQSVFTLLSGVSADEKRRLISPDFRNALSPIVRTRILEPKFARLNLQIQSLLVHPFTVGKARIVGVLRDQSQLLRTAGISAELIQEQLDTEQIRLERLRFDVPTSDEWWKTVEGKEAFAQQQDIDKQKVTAHLQNELLKMNRNTSEIEVQLKKFVGELESQRESLNAEIKSVESRNEAVQGLLADTATPFKLFTIQVRDAVLYFPMALALAWAYLTVEYVLLYGRVQRLIHTLRDLGYEHSARTFYVFRFSRIPGATNLSSCFTIALFSSDWDLLCRIYIHGETSFGQTHA